MEAWVNGFKRKRVTKAQKREWKENRVIVGNDGPRCPNCQMPMQIREHKTLPKKVVYYTRWYCCMHRNCPITTVMPEEFRMVHDDGFEGFAVTLDGHASWEDIS